MTAQSGDVAARLARLGAQAPHGDTCAEPDALWRQGRRRQGRTWFVMAACAVLLAGLGAWIVPPVLRSAEAPVAVTPQDAELVLPDVVRQPGPWEPSFPAAPGPLSAIGYAYSSGWFSDGTPFWGVSATTGESRFLDLPDASTNIDAMPVVSADGTRLAYWMTGDVPDPVPGRAGEATEAPVVGVAVLDLRTGTTTRWRRDTPRGMATDGLAWSGSVLWWSGGDWDDTTTTANGGSYEVVTRTWDLATDERAEVVSGPGRFLTGMDITSPSPDGFVVLDGLRVLEVTGTEVVVVGRTTGYLRDQTWSSPVVSPDGVRLAGVEEPDRSTSSDGAQRLLVGRIGAPGGYGDIELLPVGDVEAEAVLGWRTPTEVVVLTTDGQRTRSAELVDITTGAVRPLVDLSQPMNMPRVTADAWAGRVVPAPAAPFAPDPKKLAGGLLLAVLAVLLVAHAARGRRGHA